MEDIVNNDRHNNQQQALHKRAGTRFSSATVLQRRCPHRRALKTTWIGAEHHRDSDYSSRYTKRSPARLTAKEMGKTCHKDLSNGVDHRDSGSDRFPTERLDAASSAGRLAKMIQHSAGDPIETNNGQVRDRRARAAPTQTMYVGSSVATQFLKPSLESLRRLAGKVLIQGQGPGLAVKGFIESRSRRPTAGRKRSPSARKKGSPRLNFSLPGRSKFPPISQFSRVPATTAWAGRERARSSATSIWGTAVGTTQDFRACRARNQDLPGVGFQSFIVEHPCEAQEIQGNRVRRGLGSIVVFLQRSGNQRIAGGTAEITPS